MTAVTAVLVLVSGSYAYQALERQRGASEFEVVKKSLLAFDDAVRDVAWDFGGIRSARFTVNYGQLELMPNDTSRGLPLAVTVTEHPGASYSSYTGYLKYNLSTNYVNFGSGYESYLLGNSKTVVSTGTEGFGRALIKQEPGWITVNLNYRVRAMRTLVVNVTEEGQPVQVNYVDVLIVKIYVAQWWTYVGDFDLKARNMGITTMSYGPYTVTGGACTVSVNLGGSSSSVVIGLASGKVVFNFVVAEVLVST